METKNILIIFISILLHGANSHYHGGGNQYLANGLPAQRASTEYGFESVQTGSAYVPMNYKSPPVQVRPDESKSQYYFVQTNKTSHHLPLRSHQRRTSVHPTPHRQHRRSRVAGDCIKCPPEKILIAQKGLDGVLVDPPKLLSCHNRAILNGAYQIETLFGNTFRFLLPHGTHSFHGRIRNKRNGSYEQICILRYKVVVQQCGRFYPQDVNLRSKCDLGYIWGSKCHFTCRSGYLSHNKPMVCGDSLQWEGDEPECLPERMIEERKSCDFLSIPDNGRFSCEYPNNVDSESYENDIVTPNGSICRIKCNRLFEIPPYLERYSVLRCESGHWNTTVNNICRPKKGPKNSELNLNY